MEPVSPISNDWQIPAAPPARIEPTSYAQVLQSVPDRTWQSPESIESPRNAVTQAMTMYNQLAFAGKLMQQGVDAHADLFQQTLSLAQDSARAAATDLAVWLRTSPAKAGLLEHLQASAKDLAEQGTRYALDPTGRDLIQTRLLASSVLDGAQAAHDAIAALQNANNVRTRPLP